MLVMSYNNYFEAEIKGFRANVNYVMFLCAQKS